MSQLSDVITAQKSLEECFLKKMGDLEAQIQNAGPAKDTVAKLAEEFRSFRELVFNMLGLLRRQILECSRQMDAMETRHRRKALVFQGLPESDGEDSRAVILRVLGEKLTLKNVTASSITVCHRLGVPSKEHHRPILVKFAGLDLKAAVWRAKSGLKGSSITVKEFLTKARQTIFGKARQHFGMRLCWTQDGIIFVKASDGSRHRVTNEDELSALIKKYPRASSGTSSTSGGGASKQQ